MLVLCNADSHLVFANNDGKCVAFYRIAILWPAYQVSHGALSTPYKRLTNAAKGPKAPSAWPCVPKVREASLRTTHPKYNAGS